MEVKNRRTLKKRIRRVISLCILVAVILFGGLVLYMTSYMAKSQAQFATQYYSYFIGNTMNSDYFLKQTGIDGLEKFDPSSSEAKEWISSLDDLGKSAAPEPDPVDNFNMSFPHGGDINIKIREFKGVSGSFPFIELDKVIHLYIQLNGREIYNNGDVLPPDISFSTSERGSLFNKLLDYFKAESTYPLMDSLGNRIGSVTAGIDSQYILGLFISMAVIVVFIGLLCLIAANLLSKFFTISITKPIVKLEEKIKAMASGNYKDTLNSQIILNKPLMEIESLASSTNQIMHKMKDYSNMVESQKLMLESQNEELEAQNEELVQARLRVEQTQTLLVQNEKMVSIGQLTAAITHEINTPLGAINSNVQLFSMLINMLESNNTVDSNTGFAEIVSQLKEANSINVLACERVIQIIKSLKTFTKLDQAEFQSADINEGIKSALVLTSNLWKRKISIFEDYGKIPHIRCFPGLLNQVFMNIIVNAIQAIEDTGEIYIRTSCDEQNVYVSVKDTGNGIKEKDLPHIFDAGFSTKAVGAGAGLGLSICSNIIKKHNGDIKVISQEGSGSEFMVSIPIQL